jgi:hypothetical protein
MAALILGLGAQMIPSLTILASAVFGFGSALSPFCNSAYAHISNEGYLEPSLLQRHSLIKCKEERRTHNDRFLFLLQLGRDDSKSHGN